MRNSGVKRPKKVINFLGGSELKKEEEKAIFYRG
jgi:hypothetical protein